MKRKLLTTILLSALTISLFAGCGGSQDTSADETAQKSEEVSDNYSDADDTSKSDPLKVGMLGLLNMSEEDFKGLMEQLKDINEDEAHVKIAHTADDKAKNGLEFTYFENLQSLLLAVKSETIDEIFINKTTARYLVSTNPKLTIAEMYTETDGSPEADFIEKVFNDSYSFLLLKENEALAGEIDGVIKAMKDDGTLDSLAKEQIDAKINGEEVTPIDIESYDGADKIRVAVTGDLPPLDYISADGNPAGFNTAILAEIGRRLKKNIELVNIESGARSIALSSGEVDMVFWTRGSNEDNSAASSDADKKEVLDKLSTKDIPDGTITTKPYYSDSQVRVYLSK